MAKNEKLETASVLAFERKLANSDGLMFSGQWGKQREPQSWQPIQIQTKSVRGTISNRLSRKDGSDPAKLDAKIQSPNLQTVDTAALPFDTDTLKITFTLRVHGNLSMPSACNSPEYQKALSEMIEMYRATHTFSELASRYAYNIANGRFLWRNRIGAEAIEVHVRTENRNKFWIFKGNEHNLNDFPSTGDHIGLAEEIALGLDGQESVFLSIDAYILLGHGQEVFPSQELVLSEDRDKKGKKSKTLYQVDGIAALHSQKIGNALRTVDTWHPEAHEIGPIAVEPYGSVTNRGKAYRQPQQKCDFYSILDGWLLQGKIPQVDEQHFVIANLIRGGVFGEKSE